MVRIFIDILLCFVVVVWNMTLDFRVGEKKREIVKQRLRKLPEYVRDAVSNLKIEKKAGRPEQSRRDHTTLQRKTVL